MSQPFFELNTYLGKIPLAIQYAIIVSRMRLYEIIWKEQFVVKLEEKHRVFTDEVEAVLFNQPFIRRIEKGRIQGEDLYVAYGQTETGRYLVVFFVNKKGHTALPISARDMTKSERRYYERQK